MGNVLIESGEVLQSFDAAQYNGDGKPVYQVGEKAYFRLGTLMYDPIPVIIRGVHFYNEKVKYDLGIVFPEMQPDGKEAWVETRIYNVDSIVIFPWRHKPRGILSGIDIPEDDYSKC